MARLAVGMFGGETGLLTEWGIAWNGDATATNATDQKRTGSYALKLPSFTGNTSNDRGRQMSVGSLSEVYLAVGLRVDSFVSTANTYPTWSPAMFIIQFLEGSTRHVAVALRAPSNTVTAVRGNNPGTEVAASATGLIAANQWYLLQVYVKIADSGGRVVVKVDGVTQVDFTGDTRNGATGVINSIVLGQQTYGPGDGSSFPNTWFDDFCINDTTGSAETSYPAGGAVLYLKTNGNGNSSQLVGSDSDSTDNYLLVQDVPPNTATYVESITHDNEDTYAVDDVPAPYVSVRLVQPIMYAALAAAGTGNADMVLRSGGADYEDAAAQALGTDYAFYRGDVRYVDPADSSGWTPTKVNALQPGPKVKA